jgi:hypothetical protein
MSNIESTAPEIKASRPGGSPDSHNSSFSPVSVTDTTGVVFLGAVAIMLCIVLLSALSHNRALDKELALLRQRMVDR